MARAGVTFRYTDTYPMGLVEGVNALVFSSRGGVHRGQTTDAVTPYLQSVLGLMGITEVEFVYAEGWICAPRGGAGNARGPCSDRWPRQVGPSPDLAPSNRPPAARDIPK